MDIKDEIIEELEFLTKAERTDLAARIITSSLISLDAAQNALGLDYDIRFPMFRGCIEADMNMPIYEQLGKVSTEDMKEYVKKIMQELV